MIKRTVREALQHVADYPVPVSDDVITQHTGELISRTLFDIANTPDANVRGSMGRANKARKMIMDRLDGKRRPGSTPIVRSTATLTIQDMTGKELDDE